MPVCRRVGFDMVDAALTDEEDRLNFAVPLEGGGPPLEMRKVVWQRLPAPRIDIIELAETTESRNRWPEARSVNSRGDIATSRTAVSHCSKSDQNLDVVFALIGELP